jgi:predicted metalloprotease
MRWRGRPQSENLEDRRRMSPRGMAIGGGGLLVLLVLGLLFGLDPQQLNQLLNQAQVGAGPNANGQQQDRPLTAEEEQTREFAATILRFTEVVWDDQFRRAGERYQPPKMVLFSSRVQTGCGIAPAAVGPF